MCYSEPRSGAHQVRSQAHIVGQEVYGVGFVEGEYGEELSSSDSGDHDSGDSESDSRNAGPDPGRAQAAREDDGCGDRDIQPDSESGSELEVASFSFANVVSKADAALQPGIQVGVAGASESGSDPVPYTNIEHIPLEMSAIPSREEIAGNRTVREVTRQILWSHTTDEETKLWLRMMKSSGFCPQDLAGHSTRNSLFKKAGLLDDSVLPQRVDVGKGMQDS